MVDEGEPLTISKIYIEIIDDQTKKDRDITRNK